MYEIDATLIQSYTAEASLQLNVYAEGGAVPVITEIDGGDSGNDSQFTPINGVLDGGGS
jgi:hypothetical protein